MIAAAVLAAGESRRFDGIKAIALWQGEPLVRRVARIAREGGCDPIWIVTGAHQEQVCAACDLPDVKFVQNPQWSSGIGSSVAIAARQALEHSSTSALLLLTVDQIRLDVAVVERLVESFNTGNRGIVACRYGGTVGIPAIFDREHFQPLTKLSGSRGAKSYLQNRSRVIDWEHGAEDADRRLPER